ncbi:MAG: hypothetical protein WBK20_04740, partial [Spirochaetota bacterium]
LQFYPVSYIMSLYFLLKLQPFFSIYSEVSFNNNLTVNIGGMYSPEASLKGSNTSQFISAYKTSMSQYSLDMGIAYVF